jgi:NAD(P)-dependent dehydrogenase (short-subunit alcohol dehydrogenase family)
MSEDAVVVGATGTLGSALVRRLASRGLRVVAVARSEESLSTMADSIDGEVAPCPADIASNDAIAAIQGALSGQVRIAVLAAGLPVRGSVATIDADLLAVGAQVKMGGIVRLLQAVRPSLGPGSRFVAVAGTLGLEPGRDEAGPGGINAGLINLMKQISQHHGPDGVTVHTVVPGPMDTPRLRTIAGTIAAERGTTVEEVWEEYGAKVSLGRLPRVDEVVWAIENLLAPEADVMHGTVLHLDAGGLRSPH